jgi:hypothetical protein
VRLSHGNIGHCDVTFYNANSNLNRFEEGTENPRVGGSIPPLATSNFLFSQYLQSGCAAEIRWLCRICAVFVPYLCRICAVTFRVVGIGHQMLCREVRVTAHHLLGLPAGELL